MKEKKGYKWEVLGLLWFAYLLNQADRQAFNVVLPLIREDLALTDLQIGLIATLFNCIYAILVPVAGYVGDRFSQKWILSLSVFFWSFATMLTGFSSGIIMLILTRSLATGAGEAFFGPPNYSMLARYHKEDTRSFAMSIHQTAYYVGIIVSGLLAGYIGEHYGWRNAFFVFGGVGIIHAIVMIVRLKDKAADTDEVPKTEKKAQETDKIGFFDGFKIVLKTPSALALTAGFSGLIFVLTGYLTWMPTYLYETFDMGLTSAGFNSVFYTHLFAFFGVLVAGRMSDKLARKLKPSVRMMMQGISLLVAAPFIILMGNSTILPVIYVGFAGFGFARAFFDANTYTVLYDVIPPKYHASASGVMIMTGFLIGSLSPAILGYLKPLLGLSMGITLLSVVWVICGLLLVFVSKYRFQKDYERIH